MHLKVILNFVIEFDKTHQDESDLCLPFYNISVLVLTLWHTSSPSMM